MNVVVSRIMSLIPRKPDGKFVHGAKKTFCESIGAPTNIISEWEKGVTQSYRNYLYRIAATYNVSVEWLKGETDEKNPAPTNGDGTRDLNKEIIDLVSLLDEKDQTAVLEIVQTIVKSRGKDVQE